MRHYFLNIKLWQPKNKANAIMSEIAHTYNHYLVDEVELKKLEEHLRDETERVNQLHPRCTDMEFRVRNFIINDGSMLMAIEDNFQISVTQVEQYMLTEPVTGEKWKKV